MTDKKTEALKLALEALENAQANVGNWWPDEISAIREALAEQPAQQEPFVTKNKSGITLHVGWDDLPVGTKLYTSPPASKPWVSLTDEEVKHEWVVWRASIPRYMGFAKGIEAKLKEKNT